MIATTPTVSTTVAERIRTGKIEAEDVQAEAVVCGTRPEYFELLEEAARVKLRQGRLFSSAEAEEGANVVVLSDQLARKLFPAADPVGRTVVLESLELAVVGVVSDGAKFAADVARDAYVPLKLFGPGKDPSAPFRYDRLRFRVDRLDQLKNTHSVVQEIIERRHPGQSVRVTSLTTAED